MERRCNLEKIGYCKGCWALSFIDYERKRVPKQEEQKIIDNLSKTLCPPGTSIQITARDKIQV